MEGEQVRVFMCMCVYMCVFMCVCVCVYVCVVCVWVCVGVCVRACMCLCMCVYVCFLCVLPCSPTSRDLTRSVLLATRTNMAEDSLSSLLISLSKSTALVNDRLSVIEYTTI